MLLGEIRPVASLTDAHRAVMLEIMTSHYANVSGEAFEKDLSEKDGVLLLADREGRVQGFSTYVHLRTTYRGDAVTALFSGDTIIRSAYWGSQALFSTFGRLLHRLMEENPGSRTYWFLITKGFRTYLMLPLFFREFFPRHDRQTPPYEAGLIRHLAEKKYNGLFDARRGVIAAESYFLRDEFAQVPERKHTNQNVRFFLEKNPGYTRGEELACICEIRPENFRRRTRMLVRP